MRFNFHTPNFNLADFFKLKSSIGVIERNRKTKHYNYADLAAVEEALAEHLGDRWVFQDFISELHVVTRLYDLKTTDIDGQFAYIEQSTLMPPDMDGQDTGKLETYFRRYHRVVLLNLKTEDNDAASPKRATTNTQRRSSRRTRKSTAEDVI